jgi:hypothetical protein
MKRVEVMQMLVVAGYNQPMVQTGNWWLEIKNTISSSG